MAGEGGLRKKGRGRRVEEGGLRKEGRGRQRLS